MNNSKPFDENLIENIKQIIYDSRRNVLQKINHQLIFAYWEIGREIVSSEHKNLIDKQTSRQIILSLSKQLTKEIGKGFLRSNLFNMRKLYQEYPDVQTLSGHLSWSHLCELLILKNKEKRVNEEN